MSAVQYKICIDAGHGGKDPGAVSGSYYEKTAALQIALKLNAMLKKCGFAVKLTRNSDTYPSLTERARVANTFGADIFISIHLNAGASKANGIETLAYRNSGKTGTLAAEVHKAMITATNARDRGIKERPDLAVLNSTVMPAILIETGFISNAEEREKLFSGSYQDLLCNAIVSGVCNYFGVKIEIEEKEEVNEMRYKTLGDIPKGEFYDVISTLINKGYLQGYSGTGDNTEIDLSADMVRMFVINFRAGLYK